MVVSLPSSDERTPRRLSPRSCKLERPSVVLARVLPVAVKRFGVVGYQVEESDDLVCSRRRGLSGGGTRRWMLSRPVWRVGEGGMSDRSRLSPISACAFRCNSLPAPLLITPSFPPLYLPRLPLPEQDLTQRRTSECFTRCSSFAIRTFASTSPSTLTPLDVSRLFRSAVPYRSPTHSRTNGARDHEDGARASSCWYTSVVLHR